jgi:hypothetical protein
MPLIVVPVTSKAALPESQWIVDGLPTVVEEVVHQPVGDTIGVGEAADSLADVIQDPGISDCAGVIEAAKHAEVPEEAV